MPEDRSSLIDVLTGARGGDSSPELMVFDLPGLFETTKSPGTARPPRTTGKLAMDLNCVSFSKVFVLWRPWTSCVRCKLEMAKPGFEFPTTGDYRCPHIEDDEYKRVKDMCLRGEAVLQKEDFFNVRSDDSRCVHILWWRLDEASMEKMKKRAEGNRPVFPPNPEAVFAEGKEKDKKDAEAAKPKAPKKTRGSSKDTPML
jgi:hypothetical protein